MAIMAGRSSSRSQDRVRKAWFCAVAIAGMWMFVASAGASTPTVPGAPTITSVRAIGLNSVTVAFTKPVHDGGSRIRRYQAVCTSTTGGVLGTHISTGSPIRVRGLTADKTYTCTVTASNDAGAGPASARSAAVVALPTLPSRPRIASVRAEGLRSLTVVFTKPAEDGGVAILNYRATCTSTKPAVIRSREGEHSPITVNNLTAAVMYRCTVTANNRVGSGRASAPSSSVEARPVAPGAPTITSIRAGVLGSITLAFTGPVDDGGTPIRHYFVECSSTNGGVTRSRAASRSPIRVAGLTTRKIYTCTVAANNGVRLGPASRPSKPVVPRAP
jgi:hypothetical protein